MRPQIEQQPLAAMLALFGLGFASIQADEIPEGIMPKRQVVGTGVTTATSTETSTIGSTTVTSVVTSTSVGPTTITSPTSDTTQITSATPITTQTSASSATSQGDSTVVIQSTTASDTAVSSASSAQGSSNQESSAASSQAATSSEVPTTVAVTTTNSDGSTVTSHIATSTLAAVSSRQTSSGVVRTLTGSASNLVVLGSSTINRSTLQSATTITSALIAAETVPSTFTSYWTSNGQVYSSVYTTDRVFSSTTGYATATISPELANGGGNGSNLSTQNKSIIGGVVGGVGGAILIGGLAIVAWRLWGKKKQRQGHDDFLDSQDDSIRREKTGSGQGLGPEHYSNPNGAVNTASNF